MKRITAFVLTIILTFCFTGCSENKKIKSEAKGNVWITEGTAENDITQKNFDSVAESDDLELLINPNTTDIAVMVKKTGYVWSTDRHSSEKEGNYPILSLSYEDAAGNAERMDTTLNCIKKGQYKIEPAENGIKICYTVGTVPVVYIYPNCLSEKRFMYFYEKADENTRQIMDLCYSVINLEDYSFDEEVYNQMAEKYPQSKDGPVYGVYEEVMNDSLSKELSDSFAALGYTEEDLKIDNGKTSESAEKEALFNINVIYTVDGNKLKVEIPQKEIGISDGCSLERIELFSDFSGGDYTDGYFLLPDGSGSVMEFYNGKSDVGDYSSTVYGKDYALKYDTEILKYKNATMPVFGCKENDNAYFAIIEDSDCTAEINATTGNETLIPRVWPDFTVQARDEMVSATLNDSSSGYSISVHQQKLYDGNITLLYTFFSGNDANYSHMASYYGDYLFKNKTVGAATEYPAAINIVGSVDIKKTVCGVSYRKNTVLTSVEEAQNIISSLKKDGIDALKVSYSGWFGSGYRNGILNEIKVRNDIGGLKKLTDWVKSPGKNVSVYLEADVQYAWKYACGAFGAGDKVLTKLNQASASLQSFDAATYRTVKDSEIFYALNPEAVTKGFSTLRKFCNENKIPAISFSKIATDLNSDYNESNEICRQKTGNRLASDAEKAGKDFNTMLFGGNMLTARYAGFLTDLPLCSDREGMTDYSVPFLEMALSGHIAYSGPSVNLDNAEPGDLLRYIESAAAPAFTLTERITDAADINTYNFLYASEFSAQRKYVTENYAYLKKAVGDLYSKRIVSHERIRNGVFKTVFENGEAVVVNYNDWPCTIGNQTVEAESYLRTEVAGI